MTVKLFRRSLKFNEPAKKLQAFYPHLMMLTNTRFLVTVLVWNSLPFVAVNAPSLPVCKATVRCF